MNTKRCLLLFLTVVWLCLAGCGKKEAKATEPSTDTQPSATTPSKPVPSSSAAQKVGLYVFASNKQTRDQQLIDEAECYDLAKQQSGVNPEMAPPAPPTSADIQAAQAQGAASAKEQKGGRARGAARGAAGGAMIGAMAGDSGTGAAIGATLGTARGGRQQRQANAAAKDQAASQAGAQIQEQYKVAKNAYDQQISKYKRAFSACLDARGYSVK